MNNWKEHLHVLVVEKKWEDAVRFLEERISKSPQNVEEYIQIIYLIHNILLEEEYPESLYNVFSEKLKYYFDASRDKFSDNSEYLFFIGKILHIAEWYFGLNDNKLAVEMQRKAAALKPDNILFEWAYRVSCEGDVIHNYLASEILKDKNLKAWLSAQGFPGEYVLNHLKASVAEL